MTPKKVRMLAARLRKHVQAINEELGRVPSEAYKICGHIVVADASTRSIDRLASSLEYNADKFAEPQ